MKKRNLYYIFDYQFVIDCLFNNFININDIGT